MHEHHEEFPQAVVPDLPHRRLLAGQTAIVTGASSGIGQAVAISLDASGANVCVNFFSDPEGAHETVAQIESHGSHAFAHQADTSKEADVTGMFEATCK